MYEILVHLLYFGSSQMKSPGVTTSVNGKNKTLYMQTVKSIEERTKENLKKTLKGKKHLIPYYAELGYTQF